VGAGEIRAIEHENADRAIAVQTLAFSSDPVMRWLFPEAETYLRVFPHFARCFGGGAFEHGTGYAPDDFAGAAFWLPVGQQVDPEPLLKIAEEDVRESIRGDVLSIFEQMEHHHIDEPHWYLAIIGVDPARQGRGLGASMLAHTLRICDEGGYPAYLESSNPANITLYQRHGFEISGEIQAGDSPVITPMIRRR
jgi:GNAT superfamily N-acetyltransferase